MRGILISGATAFLISFLLTPAFIKFLSRKGYGQQIRDDGPKSHHIKRGTPTMGGIIILLSVLVPTLLFANLDKVYIRLMVLCTVWLGIIGFLTNKNPTNQQKRVSLLFFGRKKTKPKLQDGKLQKLLACINLNSQSNDFIKKPRLAINEVFTI